jgi:hypothetical protein
MATQEPNYETLKKQSLEELQLKTEAHDATWHLSEADWSVDQDAGEIVFNTPNGLTATCPVQIVGTYNTADGTWLWGWDHPSVADGLDQHAERVRRYGLKHGIDELTHRKLTCTQDDAWQFAALACKIADAQGAYCGPSGTTLIYMTFGEVELSRS